MINLCYLVETFPLKSRKENLIEIFNEVCIYLCSNVMAVFLNVAMPTSLRMQLGWFLMGVAALNIVVNLALTCLSSLRDMKAEKKMKKFGERAESALKKKLDNREKLIT
jgi:Na+/melibiose symporter-like transporter